MEVTFGVNLEYFLWSLALGAAVSFAYDGLRSLRRIKKGTVWRVNLEDCLFLLLLGVLIFWLAFDKNDGKLRLEGFLGVTGGGGLYYWICKDRIVRVFVWLYEKIAMAILWLIRMLLFPVQFVYKILAKPFLVVGWYSKKSVGKVHTLWQVQKRRHELERRRKKAKSRQRKQQNLQRETECAN